MIRIRNTIRKTILAIPNALRLVSLISNSLSPFHNIMRVEKLSSYLTSVAVHNSKSYL